ncbi:MAG: ribonuclease III, partial [Epulopiscium sp.]|nr:ribonuclease III [Candidatus Epulonipiscium sp.]
MKETNFEEFEKRIGYSFSDKNTLKLAFTHSSYSNEHKKGIHENNERLEFLGDAVLDMVVSEYMYRIFPDMPEGELTKLRAGVVCEESLAHLARCLEIG